MPRADPPPLAARLAALQSRALGELDAVEAYFRDAEWAWRLVRELSITAASAGNPLDRGSPLHGRSPVAQVIAAARVELVRLAAKSQDYVAGNLTEATFQQTLAVFEAFVADLLTLRLTARPDTLGGRDVKLIRVLRNGVDAVVAEEVSQLVLHVMTGGPRQWFDALAQHAGLPTPPADQVARLVEAKATRDLLVHNRGVITPVYLKKAGSLARGADGERIEMPEPYRRQAWELVRQMAADLCAAADLPPPPAPG